ncbi:MAG: hypothetical protein II971_03045 [Firmicutes bacterium]|nr:hypothetical protein [Bacillota bacterium]
MDSRYSRDVLVLQTHCDRNLRLSIPAAAGLCLDTANIQSELYGFGVGALDLRGRYWVVSKHRFRFVGSAHNMDEVRVTTWPEKPGKLRCFRNYTIEKEGEPVAFGKSEWAVLDKESGRPTPPIDIYPKGMDLTDDTTFTDSFARISDDFESEVFAGYRITSNDIDMATHMNNVRYFWAVMGLFSSEKIEAMKIREIELHYKSQAREGETLLFQKRENEDSLELRASAGDGRTVLLARILKG